MRRLAFVVGAACVAFGAYKFVSATSLTSIRAALVWFLGGVVLHDGVVVPVTLLIGLLLARLLPGHVRGPIQGALCLSAMLTLALVPLLSGRGLDPADPSQQPLPYDRNLLIVLAIVWVGTGALVVRRMTRAAGAPAGITAETTSA